MTELNIKFIKEFYKQFKVTASTNKKLKSGADANCFTRHIRFHPNVFKNYVTDIYRLHLIFHELSHILCYDYNKFPLYHTKKSISKKMLRKVGLRAELYCDKMADRWIKSLFPGFPLAKSYRSLENKKWYKDYYLK